MNRKSKEFLDLQKEWYDKLEKSGFKDVEQDEFYLKSRISRQNLSLLEETEVSTSIADSKAEYYRLAGHFLHEYDFANDRERIIWELHADGASIEMIVKCMKFRGFKVYKRLVHETLQRLAKDLGIKCKKRT